MEIKNVAPQNIFPSLAHMPTPPTSLWVRGRVAPPNTKYLAVVGSRALTPYGREACSKLIGGLAGYPVSIVSGMAIGADAVAHRSALTAGLHTVAVLGSGVNDEALYPRSNVGLARDILTAGGLIVSEREPNYKPQAHDFPLRNRIVVGIADAVLIVEAGERSGTLITARLAGEYGKELLCIPHRIADVHGYGAELFLRLGATYVSKSEHVLDALGLAYSKSSERPTPKLHGDEAVVYELLATPRELDEVVRLSGLPAGDTISALVMLEIQGLAKQEFGLWIRI